MPDLFAAEEELLKKFKAYLETIPEGGDCPRAALEELLDGYGRVVRQLRTLTRLSDKTTVNLNSARQDLIQKVSHDALTGVYSRRFMNEKMFEYAQNNTAGMRFCVMMIDVDFFKRYNDIYGHPMGDECLRTVAGALSGCIRSEDGFVARYGGEEFAVVLRDVDEQIIYELGDRLLHAVENEAVPHEQSSVSNFVTVSIGCVTGMLLAGRHPQAFIDAADKALYQSKQNGRNKITRMKLEEVQE